MPFEVIGKKSQFAVIGLGTFGTNVALSLIENGVEVIAVDKEKENIEKLKEKPIVVYALDATKEDALKEIGIEQVDCAIVCMGVDMIASILVTLLLKKFKIPKILARANTEEHAEILRLIGVTEVIEPEVETAKKLVKRLVSSFGYLLSFEQISKEHAIVEIRVTKKIADRTLAEVDFRKRFKLNVIAIKRLVERLDSDFRAINEYEINEVPDPNTPLNEDDILVIIGKIENINRLHNYLLGTQ
jgi:trk system potassium uptake protein TrkA